MRNVLVFGEDYGHEVVLRTLLDRLGTAHLLRDLRNAFQRWKPR